MSFPPQRVRSKHLHRGELLGGELLPILIQNPFEDPSFREMLDELSRISRTCLIEWLRCKGEYELIRLQQKKRDLKSRVRAAALAFYHRALTFQFLFHGH